MIYLYRLVTFLIYYLAYPYTALSALLGNAKWKERLGYVRKMEDKPLIWLHASSVGEVGVAGIISEAIRSLDPKVSIVITVMTEAGRRVLEEKKMNCAGVYLPLDYRSAIRRFLNRTDPDVAVFIETEIWPNLIKNLGKRNIPVYLANGRLSEKSHQSYRKFKKALASLFKDYRKLMLQNEVDRKRYIEIGADASKIEVLGSLKFDAPVRVIEQNERTKIRQLLPFDRSERIFTAGSTRPGEEKSIIDVFKKLRRSHPELKLIIAPRHLNRIEEVRQVLEESKLSYALYNNYGENKPDIVLIERIGILNDLYAVSDIAFVGGTLADLGGHNLIEPVWSGTPVLYGPSIHNVNEMARYIEMHNFGKMIKDESELHDTLYGFLSGALSFNRKGNEIAENSAARKTAATILKGLS